MQELVSGCLVYDTGRRHLIEKHQLWVKSPGQKRAKALIVF